MLQLLIKLLKLLPYPIWIKQNGSIIYMNLSHLQLETSFEIFEEQVLHCHKESQELQLNSVSYSINYLHEEIDTDLWEFFFLDLSHGKNSSQSFHVLQSILNNIPELIFYKDTNGRYQGVNQLCQDFFNDYGIEEVIGNTDEELGFPKDFVVDCIRHDQQVLDCKLPIYNEAIISHPTGHSRIMETVRTPLFHADGNLAGIIGVVRDITDRKHLENKLRFLSYNDMLTGLYNRTFFDEKIIELTGGEHPPIGIIMGDVNGLKLINDTFGHLEGDRLIRSIAEQIKAACQNNGLAFRWGGDEFIILIPNSSEEQCEELMITIDRLCKENQEEQIPLSMAMGSAILSHTTTLDHALKQAEDKLYRHKLLVSKSIRGSILSSLQETLHNKNVETEEHTKRILNYSLMIGEALHLNKESLDELALVAKLHDIGMITIPDHIITQYPNLTPSDMEILQTHSEKGYRLAMTLPELNHIARYILTHHEHWDGTGYPLGLRGEEIPLIARIITLADGIDQFYNGQDDPEWDEILPYLTKQSYKQFDPHLVRVLQNLIKKNAY